MRKFEREKELDSCGRQKTVHSNAERRSYKRVITKEVRVLKILRLMNNLTQDQASAVCGYSRPSIGHIENGRIELYSDRIKHIVTSYGAPYAKFEELMKEEMLRDDLVEFCHQKIINLPETKLKLVHSMLENL